MKKKPNSSKDKKKSFDKKSKYKLNYNFSDKDIVSQDNQIQQEPSEITQPTEEVITQDNSSIFQEINEQSAEIQKDKKTPEIQTQEIKPKKKGSIKTIISEVLFWGGLVLTAYGFLSLAMNSSSNSYLIPIVGIVVMVLSLVVYAFPLKKKQIPMSTEEKKEVPISKEIPKTKEKYDINEALSKNIQSKIPVSTPENKEIKKEEIPEEISAAAFAKKQLIRRTFVIAIIIIVLSGLLIVLYLNDLLLNIYGISTVILVLAVIGVVFMQSKRKTKIQMQTGIVSHPSPEVEQSIKKLKVTETEIDLFLDYVSQKKSILIVTAAKEFGVTAEKIEEWAKILVEHNLITIYYPAFGSASLKIVENQMKEKNGNSK